jgi:hypothetical protein
MERSINEGDLHMDDMKEGSGEDNSLRNLKNNSIMAKTHEPHETKKDDAESDDDMSADQAEDYLDDPLDIVPPNFALARKHQDANRVKNISEDIQGGQMFDEVEDF